MTCFCRTFVFFAAVLFTVSAPLFARSWSDLYSDDVAYYGKERELKLPLRLFFVQREKWEAHEAFHFFWFLAATDYPKYAESQFLPLYKKVQSKFDNRAYFWTLLHYQEVDGDSHFNHAAYLFYWGDNRQRNEYFHMFVPLYYYSQDNPESSFIATPLGYRDKEISANRTAYSLGFPLVPLFYYHTHESKGVQPASIAKNNASIPIMPVSSNWVKHLNLFFILFNEYESNTHRISFLTPLYYYYRDNQLNRQFLLTPLFYTGTLDSDRHRSVLWMYYWGGRGSDEYYRALLPIWWQFEDLADKKLLLITPVYMRYENHNGSVLSILPPFTWFVNYRDGSSQWLLFPFWYRYDSNSEQKRISPLYISLTDEKSKFQLLLPFYLQYKNKDSNFHLNVTGVSLSEERLSMVPISGFEKNGKIFVDWDFGWFYNLIRISSRDEISAPYKAITGAKGDSSAKSNGASIGQNAANAALSLGKSDTKLDVPVAENRRTVQSDQKNDPTLSHYRRRDRESSENFWGFYSLFGALAYEKADHYRHFRLLPLSWLTWQKDNNNGLRTFLPFYVYYQNDTERYHVIAPIYAHQERKMPEGISHITSWLLLLYMDEYEAVEQKTEKTYLWPLINYYTSPTRGGFRLFPLFWYKSEQQPSTDSENPEKLVETYWHISPLHYAISEDKDLRLYTPLFYSGTNEKYNQFGIWGVFHQRRYADASYSNIWILPYYHSFEEYSSEDGKLVSESISSFAGLLWYYHQRDKERSLLSWSVSPLHYYSNNSNRGRFVSPLFYQIWDTNHASYGIPLIFHRKISKGGQYRNLWLFPYYQSSDGDFDRVYAFFPLVYSHTTSESRSLFLFGYYHARRSGYANDHFLFLLGRSAQADSGYQNFHAGLYAFDYENHNSGYKLNILYGLGASIRSNANRFSWHFGLVAGYENYRVSASTHFHHRLVPLWWYTARDKAHTLLLFPLLSYFSEYDDGNRRFDLVGLGTLYYRNADLRANSDTMAVLMGILYYHAQYPERNFHSYGSMWGLLWHYEKEEGYKRFSILTFLYSRSELNGEVRHKIFGISL